jgi:hypothetical protein
MVPLVGMKTNPKVEIIAGEVFHQTFKNCFFDV